jgi:hypothetical protein
MTKSYKFKKRAEKVNDRPTYDVVHQGEVIGRVQYSGGQCWGGGEAWEAFHVDSGQVFSNVMRRGHHYQRKGAAEALVTHHRKLARKLDRIQTLEALGVNTSSGSYTYQGKELLSLIGCGSWTTGGVPSSGDFRGKVRAQTANGHKLVKFESEEAVLRKAIELLDVPAPPIEKVNKTLPDGWKIDHYHNGELGTEHFVTRNSEFRSMDDALVHLREESERAHYATAEAVKEYHNTAGPPRGFKDLEGADHYSGLDVWFVAADEEDDAYIFLEEGDTWGAYRRGVKGFGSTPSDALYYLNLNLNEPA